MPGLPLPKQIEPGKRYPRLTPNQFRVWTCMRNYQEIYGVSPTIDEITEQVGLKNRNSTTWVVSQLIKLGWVVRRGKTKRYTHRGCVAILPDNGDFSARVRWRAAKIWAVLMPCSKTERTAILQEVNQRLQGKKEQDT